MLAPVFDEAADKVTAEFPTPGRVVMGKVDCDKEGKYLVDSPCFASDYLQPLFSVLHLSLLCFARIAGLKIPYY